MEFESVGEAGLVLAATNGAFTRCMSSLAQNTGIAGAPLFQRVHAIFCIQCWWFLQGKLEEGFKGFSSSFLRKVRVFTLA